MQGRERGLRRRRRVQAFEACFVKCQTQDCIEACLPLLLDESDFDLYNAQVVCLCDDACVDECFEQCN